MSAARAPAPPEPPFASSDPIAAWLDVLTRLLRLPAGEREEIRDELESHLRERVRDLMLEGHGEEHAVTRAIAELGEAAQLAERFRGARHRPFLRRHAMNLSILTVAGAAAVMSVIAVTNSLAPPSPQGSRQALGASTFRGFSFTPAPEGGPEGAAGAGGDAEPSPPLGDIPILSRLFVTRQADGLEEVAVEATFSGTPLEQVLSDLAEAAGMPSIVRWEAFDSVGIPRDHDISLDLDKQLPLPTIIRLVNVAIDARGGSRIEYRVSEGIIEFAPRAYFDEREVELVSYDLAPITSARGVRGEEVVSLITSLVEMENWVDNGGEIATAHALADRLFISAPPRMHERISWILRQLEGPGAARAGEAAAVSTVLDAFGSPIVQ